MLFGLEARHFTFGNIVLVMALLVVLVLIFSRSIATAL
jgi:hypothetical protein